MPTKATEELDVEAKHQKASQIPAQNLVLQRKGEGSVASESSRGPVITKDGSSAPGTQSTKRDSGRHMPAGDLSNPLAQTR